MVTSEGQGWLAGVGGCRGGARREERGKGQRTWVWLLHPSLFWLASCYLPIWTTLQKLLLPPTDLPYPRGKSSRQKLLEGHWQQAGHFLLVRLLIWGSLHSSKSECARPLPATQGGPGLFPLEHLLSEILPVGRPASRSWVSAFSELRESASSEKAVHGLAIVRGRKGPEVQTQEEGNVQMGMVPVHSQGLAAPAHPFVVCSVTGTGTL